MVRSSNGRVEKWSKICVDILEGVECLPVWALRRMFRSFVDDEMVSEQNLEEKQGSLYSTVVVVWNGMC